MPLQGEVSIIGLVNSANATAQDRGFYDPNRWYADGFGGNGYRRGMTNEQLLHMAIEVGEAADHYRKTGKFDDHALEEIADVFIVAGDLIGRYGFGEQFQSILAAKLDKNRKRAKGYGNARVTVAACDCEYPGDCQADPGCKTCCSDPGDCNDAQKGAC